MGAPPCGSDYTTTGASRVSAGEVLMAILDDVIGVFSPGWKAARLRSRAVI
ncbi:TPA: phage portal protein, partial [Escherichia coli]